MTQEQLTQLLSREILGNTLEACLSALALFVAILIWIKVVRFVVVRRLRRRAKTTATDVDDFLVGLFRHVGPFVYLLIGLFIALQSLALRESLRWFLQCVLVIVLTVKVVLVLQDAAVFFLRKWAARAEPEDPTNAVVIGHLSKVIRILLWLGGAVFVLDNLGVNITSVIAGLGIGGVAVALAAQAALGDAFSSLAIFLDKPFKVGDFIIVGDLMGTVEHVGFKTTRLRSLHGEQLICSNSDMTGSRVRNYQRMETRRVAFKLGVVYQTTTAQVKAIPGIIRAVIEAHTLAKFDRAHFLSYGDFALIFEVVYYVLSPDYNAYMDLQQDVNVRIKEEFERAGVEFAYPTQQLYVTKAEPPP